MLTNEDYRKLIHETKNSITIINGYLQLLEKKYPNINSFDYWTDAKFELSHLHTILTKLSQFKFGQNLEFHCIDIRLFIIDCYQHKRLSFNNKDIYLHIDFEDTPLWTYIDSLQFRHAIINIVNNACDVTENEGCIHIKGYRHGDLVHIDIADCGGGLNPDIAEHIFTPFVTTKSDGTGLGLTITKQIIKAHNGSITFTSQDNVGCTFHITLPYKELHG